jgi:hypothetical protein
MNPAIILVWVLRLPLTAGKAIGGMPACGK